jgi:enamine deaminase RidA (YjgF/YER057c/UK114 family)
MKQLISSGSPWEDVVGYSRAVRLGNIIEVAGTTAMDGDKLVGKGDIYAQTVYVIQKIEKALQEAGATLHDVVRTRIYVTDIGNGRPWARRMVRFLTPSNPLARW